MKGKITKYGLEHVFDYRVEKSKAYGFTLFKWERKGTLICLKTLYNKGVNYIQLKETCFFNQ